MASTKMKLLTTQLLVKSNYLSGACLLQNATEAMYAFRSKGTPEPPSSFPSALRNIVIGCMGSSWSTSYSKDMWVLSKSVERLVSAACLTCALIEIMPHGEPPSSC